jgi:predicted kinase
MKSPEGDIGATIAERPAQEIFIKRNTLVFVIGVPGSGKSTFAREHFPSDAIISTDRIRGELSNNEANQLVSENAFKLAAQAVEERLKRGEIVVLDAQNLSRNNRAQFVEIAKRYGSKVQGIFLDTSIAESIKRDEGRGRKVGSSYIRQRSNALQTAKRLLPKDPSFDALHIVAPDESAPSVFLPHEYAEALAADKEFAREAGKSASTLLAVHHEILEGEESHEKTVSLPAGSVAFVEYESPEQTQSFIERNFMEYQNIDVVRIARRLSCEVDDEAVGAMVAAILKQRIWLNLTTTISAPVAWPHKAACQEAISVAEKKRGIAVGSTTILIGNNEQFKAEPQGALIRMLPEESALAHVSIERDVPEDAPLFVIGDVQGCYTAMRKLTGDIRHENLEHDKHSEPRRTIVFVGDMADRGPYDAEAVIYITGLVRSGRAILVRGNHDENLLKALRGEEVKSSETRETARQLRERLKPASIQKIIEVIERAPYFKEWQGLVVAHASLPRIPRSDENLTNQTIRDTHVITHGAKSGAFVGGRIDVMKLHETVAHDLQQFIVGGHTHEDEPVVKSTSKTVVLDASVEERGRLYGMYYPEMEFASAEEPKVLQMREILLGDVLPSGKKLLDFVAFADQLGMIELKRGAGEYEGLTVASYSGITEMSNLWERYPVLRHFRGLILDNDGEIIARPFQKTHKAGDEIPLDQLTMVPDKVFEKANGSLGVVYHWHDQWHISTKFSFDNDYTRHARAMLDSTHALGSLDSTKTYLFEIILPDDGHIVDYGGQQELILLNVVDTKSGATLPWEQVAAVSGKIGIRTARDMTAEFPHMSVADIYTAAQTEGRFSNLEGMMALCRETDGSERLIKIKTKEYNDKKFARDHCDWETLFDALDTKTLNISEEKREQILSYNIDNVFANAVIETRLRWIREQYLDTVAQIESFLIDVVALARDYHAELFSKTKDNKQSIDQTLKEIYPFVEDILTAHTGRVVPQDKNASMAFIRSVLRNEENPSDALVQRALGVIRAKIASEEKKRGPNAFWILPHG